MKHSKNFKRKFRSKVLHNTCPTYHKEENAYSSRTPKIPHKTSGAYVCIEKSHPQSHNQGIAMVFSMELSLLGYHSSMHTIYHIFNLIQFIIIIFLKSVVGCLPSPPAQVSRVMVILIYLLIYDLCFSISHLTYLIPLILDNHSQCHCTQQCL